MTCATVRIEEDDRTLEFFRCKAQGAGELPPGAYRPPETNWNSDFDRRRATDHVIRISPEWRCPWLGAPRPVRGDVVHLRGLPIRIPI